jgi:hypothetical protein
MINNFKQFVNENNLIDTALVILDETEVPFLFKSYLDTYEDKIDLLKYISDQGHGLHEDENRKKILYDSTCNMFTKKLTDAAIEAFPQ